MSVSVEENENESVTAPRQIVESHEQGAIIEGEKEQEEARKSPAVEALSEDIKEIEVKIEKGEDDANKRQSSELPMEVETDVVERRPVAASSHDEKERESEMAEGKSEVAAGGESGGVAAPQGDSQKESTGKRSEEEDVVSKSTVSDPTTTSTVSESISPRPEQKETAGHDKEHDNEARYTDEAAAETQRVNALHLEDNSSSAAPEAISSSKAATAGEEERH